MFGRQATQYAQLFSRIRIKKYVSATIPMEDVNGISTATCSWHSSRKMANTIYHTCRPVTTISTGLASATASRNSLGRSPVFRSISFCIASGIMKSAASCRLSPAGGQPSGCSRRRSVLLQTRPGLALRSTSWKISNGMARSPAV